MEGKINAGDVVKKLRTICRFWESLKKVEAPISEEHCITVIQGIQKLEDWSQQTFVDDCLKDFKNTQNEIN